MAPQKKRAIDVAIKQLQPVILGNEPLDKKLAAVSTFTQQCDNALGNRYLSAKKALYVFALTAICSLIALGIAASFGVAGVALLATAGAGFVLGAGTGLLTKNSLFKRANTDDITQFTQTIESNVRANAPS